MVKVIAASSVDTSYDHVSIGYPGLVVHDRPVHEPHNLGKGWTRFEWQTAFGDKPMRMVNDAAMQALGSDHGGRMLFLGLGTGLGSAMIASGVVQPMELAHLPWKKGKTYEEFLGVRALEANGKKTWRKHVWQAVRDLSAALESDYVVLGGGNAKLLKKLPENVSLGSNANAIKGAFLLWTKTAPQHRSPR